jgi:site-specific recombinase XerD
MANKPSRVRLSGPLVPYAAGFRAELESQGYRREPVADQLRLMAHLSRWMQAGGLAVDQLSPERTEEFLAARRQAGYTLWLSAKGLAPLLNHLRRLGALLVPDPVVPSPAEELKARYKAYLLCERGLGEASVVGYLHVARLFLEARPQTPGLGLSELGAADVIGFVGAQCRGRSVNSAKYVVMALRSLLRFCYLEGMITAPLADAVPRVAGWKLAALPKALSPKQVAAMLASCDRRTTFGRRDFAVLTLLVRLGLRAGEVAGLALDDIDWRAAELVVRGKGHKQAQLPLPADVGEAVAAWLRRGRPRCGAREVFTRVRAPHQALTSGGVSEIVAAAAKRAGLPQVHAHRLRHTAATQMLAAGAGLVEVGHVLGHSSVLTTSIYAKVDHKKLVQLAKSWPASSAKEASR